MEQSGRRIRLFFSSDNSNFCFLTNLILFLQMALISQISVIFLQIPVDRCAHSRISGAPILK